jgi:signal transduction histidine kinase
MIDNTRLLEKQNADILHKLLKMPIEDYSGSLPNVPDSLTGFINTINEVLWQMGTDKKRLHNSNALDKNNIRIAYNAFIVAREDLEKKVQQLTEELQKTKQMLECEIARQKITAEALQISEDKNRSLTERIQHLMCELLLAEENQRHRIASELHESIVQMLVFAKFKMESILQTERRGSVDRPLQEIHNIFQKSIRDLRSLIFEVSPPLLDDHGLGAALETLATQMQKQHEIKFFFCDDKKEKLLSRNLKIFLYQAVRELLVNIVKHAKADNGYIAVTRKGMIVQITVKDDGIGFDSSHLSTELAERKCFGLLDIKARLICFQGSIDIESSLGRGTKISIAAPLQQEKEH